MTEDTPQPGFYTTETYTPVANIGRHLADVAVMLARAVDQRAKRLGITGPQWVVLMRISSGVGNTASELCRSFGQDSGAMTRMLDRLEGQGLIQRERSEEDRRVVRLSLTEAGRALYPSLRPIAIDVLNHALAGFTAQEVDLFMGFLIRVLKNSGER